MSEIDKGVTLSAKRLISMIERVIMEMPRPICKIYFLPISENKKMAKKAPKHSKPLPMKILVLGKEI